MLKETLLAAALSFAFVGVAEAATPSATATAGQTANHGQKAAWHANKNSKHKKADAKSEANHAGDNSAKTAPTTTD